MGNSVNNQLQFEDVFVGNPPPLRIEYTDAPVENLELDPDNPRLRYRQQVDNKPAMEVLFESQDTKHLKEDIKQNGLFERPFVRRRPESKYRMFEGNRRAACFIMLHREQPDDPRWQLMPVRVLPEGVSDQQLASMLCQFHVAGKLKWDAHERAGMIFDMAERLKMPDDSLKTILHLGVPAIHKAVAAYRMMMEKYTVVENGRYKEQAEGKFSFFDEFQKKKPLRDLSEHDSFFADDFCRWVGEGRIPRAEDVRKLSDILADPVAERAFKQSEPAEAFRRAQETLERNDASRKSNFFRKLKEAIDAGQKATVTDFTTASSTSGRQLIQDARAVLDLIHRHSDTSAAR